MDMKLGLYRVGLRRPRWRAGLACAAGLAWMMVATAAHAAVNTPMAFSVFQPCSGSSAACTPRVLAQGRFERDAADRLAQFLRDTAAQGSALPARPVIAFDSAGGSVAGGMAMGRLIRQMQLSTDLAGEYRQLVASQAPGTQSEPVTFVQNAVCASACTLAFMGGVRRDVHEGAKFGVHQFASREGNIGDSATQTTLVILSRYVDAMGVDRRILDLASAVPNHKVYWLSSAQLRALKVDNTATALTRWEIGARPDGLPFLRVRQPISPGREAYVVLSLASDRLVVVTAVILRKAAYPEARLAQFPVGRLPETAWRVDGERIGAEAQQAWAKGGENAEAVTYRSTATFGLAVLERLGRAQSLAIDDGFGTSIDELSMATPLSAEGLAAGIGLLQRAR